jgi:hypothetical protein
VHIRRGLLIGGVVICVGAIGAPAFAKGDTTFVVSGGNLRGPVSIDTAQFFGFSGQWWTYEAGVPSINGLRFQLRLYDDWDHAFMGQWIYIPAASGALPDTHLVKNARTNDGQKIKWIAFSPAVNTAFLNATKGIGGGFPFTGAATITGLLLLVTAAGLALRSPRPRRNLGVA